MKLETCRPRIKGALGQDAMHRGVFTCKQRGFAAEVAATMVRELVHCVVVEGGSGEAGPPWGIVSDLDLVAAASVRDLDDQSAGGSAATPSRHRLAAGDARACGAAHDRAQHRASDRRRHARQRPLGVLSTLDIAASLVEQARRWHRRRGRSAAERAKCVEDHRDVDCLLHERAGDRGSRPAAATPSRRATPIPAARSGARSERSSADRDRVGDSVDAVDEDNGVGRSEETVAPIVPIAIPTSASASAGASLTPSPTITTFRSCGCAWSARTTSTFCSGVCSE